MPRVLNPKRVCKNCKKKFPQIRQLQSVCSFECAIEHGRSLAKKKKAKDWKVKKKVMKESLVTRTDLEKRLQVEINHIARLIDNGLTCISCGNGGKMNGGHFISVGANTTIRFNLHNIHRQDFHCNNHLSGNTLEYEQGLIKEYGQEYMEKVKYEIRLKYPNRSSLRDDLKEYIGRARKVKKVLLSEEGTYTATKRIELRDDINQKLGIYGD